MKKGRVEYLDFLKGICILLVVFCHYCMMPADTVLGNIVMCAAWGAVPCFFLVSGGLMHASSCWGWKKYLKKIVRTYSVLCIWKVIYFIVYSLNIDVTCSKAELIQYIFFFGSLDAVNTGVMWFMEAYLLVCIFLPVSYFLFKEKKNGRRALLFVLIVLFANEYLIRAINFVLLHGAQHFGRNVLQISIGEIIPYSKYGNMMFFFLLGAFLFEYRGSITTYLKKRKWIPPILSIAGIVMFMLVKYIENGTWRWANTYIDNGYCRIAVVVLAVGFYFIALLVPENKLTHWMAVYVGRNTQGIYYMHYIMLAMITLHFSDIYAPYVSFGFNVIRTLVITLICMLISMGLKKIPIVRHIVG